MLYRKQYRGFMMTPMLQVPRLSTKITVGWWIEKIGKSSLGPMEAWLGLGCISAFRQRNRAFACIFPDLYEEEWKY